MANEQGNNKYSIDKISEEEKRVQEILKERQEKTSDGGFESIIIRTVLIFLIGSIILLIIGIYMSASYAYNKKKCTDHVMGIVERIDISYDHTLDNDTNDTTTLYTPVFSYRYNGEYHVIDGGIASSSNIYNKGDEVDIYVDPDNPDRAFITSYDEYPETAILLIICGGLTIIAELIFILSIKVKMKKEDKHSNIENEYVTNDDYRG
jgi:hypothetical protein